MHLLHNFRTKTFVSWGIIVLKNTLNYSEKVLVYIVMILKLNEHTYHVVKSMHRLVHAIEEIFNWLKLEDIYVGNTVTCFIFSQRTAYQYC